MKNRSPKTLVYSQYPEDVERRVEIVFAGVLEQYPYPQNIDEQIDWIHNMAGALKTIEADSVMLTTLVKKWQLCISFSRQVSLKQVLSEEAPRMHEITYTQVGDYLIPNLIISDEPQPAYGKYGMLRKQHLKEHQRTAYTSLLMSGKLNQHLAEIDELARDIVSRQVIEMARRQGIDEAMKARDQMAWVGAMNRIKEQAEEIVLAEYVYC